MWRKRRNVCIASSDLHQATTQIHYFKTEYFYLAEPLCPCLVLPESFKEALATMMDMSLLKDPVFLLIGISNVFGMAGLYVPFVYLVDAAVLDVSYLFVYLCIFILNLYHIRLSQTIVQQLCVLIF